MSKIPELTPEGQRMFDNLDSYREREASDSFSLKQDSTEEVPIEKFKLSKDQQELIFVRTEIARLIKNSELVVRDCDFILSKCKTKDEYMQSEARVAKFIHTNVAERLTRVIDGLPAFDYEVKLDDE